MLSVNCCTTVSIITSRRIAVGFIAIVNDLLMGLFLFGLIFCITSVFIYTSKGQSQSTYEPHSTATGGVELDGQSYELACNLSDAPETALTGQSYPLMTPLACSLSDAPETALTGQYYELAIPLMTPLACILTQNWHKFYIQHLGKPGINYWEWKDKPESRNTCQELSFLLELPEPTGYAKEVLESLAEGKDPFFQPTRKRGTDEAGNLLAGFDDFKGKGKFTHRDFQMQAEMRLAFKEWHHTASELLGRDALKAIYKVCYGTTWEMIQGIIGQPDQTSLGFQAAGFIGDRGSKNQPSEAEPGNETANSQVPGFIYGENPKSIDEAVIDRPEPWWKVLGVQPSANSLQVETAYKKLIRIWHPDINKNPIANQMTSRINVAYEQYQLNQLFSVPHSKVMSINPNLLIRRLREWLKPLLSR
ncbi:MAG: J domain-containing protein [Xenococcaceae cyanobacterium]